MIEENELLEPLKLYNEKLKASHVANTNEYFDNLTKKANIDIAANAASVKEYNTLSGEANALNKDIKSKKTGKVLLIILICLLFATCVTFCIITAMQMIMLAIGIPIAVVTPIVAVLLIVLIVKKINPKIKSTTDEYKKVVAKANAKRDECYQQMQPLNSLFDWNIHTELVHATIPLFEMDTYFSVQRFAYLRDKFGFTDNTSEDSSTLYVQSGAILGNPFVVETARTTYMGTYTYTGRRTITYTVRVPDGRGGYTTSTRTQTLVAELTKPKPYYVNQKWVTYGCEAAPHLSFSRFPNHVEKMSEKEFDRFVKDFDKKMDKKAKKEVKSGFTPMANTEFEALFGATNRDNEMEFRLLFTPLAQCNFKDLCRSPFPYGDDFTFIKRGMLNRVKCEHSQNADYMMNPAKFFDYDYERAKRNFISYNLNYFQNFYFDMAPLMCIPLYHQYPTDEYIFNRSSVSNITSYEAETLANSYDNNYFAPDGCATPSILKSHLIKSEGDADRVKIIAYAYRTVAHVTAVPVVANNGRVYEVNVEWLEYIPIERSSEMEIQYQDTTRRNVNQWRNSDEFNAFMNRNAKDSTLIYQRDLFAFSPKSKETCYNSNELSELFKEKRVD